MRYPLKQVTRTDVNGVAYTATAEDIPVKPTREELWASWREMQAVNEAYRASVKGHGTQRVNTEAVERYHDLELLKQQEL